MFEETIGAIYLLIDSILPMREGIAHSRGTLSVWTI